VNFKELEIPAVKIVPVLSLIRDGEYQLKLWSDSFAWFVSIDCPDNVELSDNYFDIFPGEEYAVTLRAPGGIELGDISISSLNETVIRHHRV